MKLIGAHVSASGGVFNAPLNAIGLEANAFALFTKNQKRWDAAPLTETEISSFRAAMEKGKFLPHSVLPHDSYLINLGNADPEKRNKSSNAFIEELRRVEQLGLKYLNFHPGSHLKEISEEECFSLIATELNKAISETESAILVIENTAGQGSNVGYKFEHLAKIIELVVDKNRIGVCLDTCHTFASGYDLRSGEACEKTFAEFDRLIGFSMLKALHLNDAKSEFQSKVDRHELIGKGNIGLDCFKYIMKDKRFDNIPLILETPDETAWAGEIKLLKSFI